MIGVTPQYVAAIRASGPQFRRLDEHQIVELHAKRVTPQFIRTLAAAGFGKESPETIGAASVLGLTTGSIVAYGRVGPRHSLSDLIELRMMGVSPEYIATMQRPGTPPLTKQQLIEARLFGVRSANRARTP